VSQKLRSSGIVVESQTTAATMPPGRATRTISRTPATVHELHHKLREHDVELAVGKRQVLAGADADVRARDASATGLGERLGGVDRGHMLGTDDAGDGGRQRAGATAHVEHARARADASDLDQAAGKLGPVATDVAVVGLGGAGHDARASARGVAGD
jgi:hypothetical protein